MAPRSQESQNFFTQLETAPKFEDLPTDTKKEILGNPDDWSKIEKPKVERPKKEKKIKPQPVKIEMKDWFVTFKVNVKGDKKEVGYLIKAHTESKALDQANIRAKREFSGLRSMTYCRVRLATEEDKEYLNDIIEEAKKVVVPETPVEEPKDDSQAIIDKLLDGVSEELRSKSIWRVVFTPGRKPRKRDHDKSFFVVHADSLEEAKAEAKRQVQDELGLPYKDKWANIFQDSLDNILNSKSFKEYAGEVKDLMDKKDILGDNINIHKIQLPTPPEVEEDEEKDGPFLKGTGIEVAFTDNKYIKAVKPGGLNIFEMQNLKTYKINPVSPNREYPTVEVLAPSPANALLFFSYAVRVYDRPYPLYKDLKSMGIINPDTGRYTAVEAEIIYKDREEE